MLAVAFPRGTRGFVGALAVMVCVGAAVPALLRNAGASPDRDRLAARMLRLDPAARVGGNTQVATLAGSGLVGVPGRVNFILGLGHRQRIIGGDGHDQLGARGHGARIRGARGPDLIHGGRGDQRLHGGHGHDMVHGSHGHDMVHGSHGHDMVHGGHGHDVVHGGHGHDMVHGGHGHDRLRAGHGHDVIRGGHGHDRIHGGRGHDRIHGGAGRDRLEGGHGRDRLIDREGATVAVAGPGDRVDVADGDSDRVLCAAGSTNRIVVDRDDRLHPNCRGPASSVSYRRPSNGAQAADAPAAHAAEQPPVSGAGTYDSPYTAECIDPQNVTCTVASHASRSLTGLWANEYVPAYQCPASHPYLEDQNYAPAGTALPQGVAVAGLGPIGVSITGTKTREGPPEQDGYIYEHTIATSTGFPNSSATNWETDTNSYQVYLHCTSNRFLADRRPLRPNPGPSG
jgi:RTX calcium-binding nonapeptide repeat (4 copies)